MLLYFRESESELFSFLLNSVFVAASKPKATRNKTGLSRIENKTSFEFLLYFRFESVN
jgi:hypothetical protein